MREQKDHTVLVVVSVLIGIVLTATIGILGSIYNHNKDIERDEFYAKHCQKVLKITDTSYDPAKVQYTCAQ